MSQYQNDNQDQQFQSGGYTQQPNYQQPPQFQPYYQPPKTNGKSIATLVLGIVSIVIPYIGFLPGIVGIILGAMSLKEIKLNGEQGRGMAIGGLVCSIIGTILWGVVLLIVIGVFVFFANESSNLYY